MQTHCLKGGSKRFRLSSEKSHAPPQPK